MSQQSRSSLKPSSLRDFRIRPELRGILLRRLRAFVLLGGTTLVCSVFLTMEVVAGRSDLIHTMLAYLLTFFMGKEILFHCKSVARASHQLETGKSEDVEILLERSPKGFIARVRSALDFSVSDEDPSEIYFVDRSSHRLITEAMIGRPLILPAVYGFDPDDPLLVRTSKGVLWLGSRDAECSDEASAILLKAYSLYGNNQDEAAIATLNNALRVNPKYVDALELRGYCKQRMNDVAGAINDFTAVLQERSRSLAGVADLSASYLARASAYMEMEDFRLALADLDTAITLTPDNADLYSVRATAHEQLNQGALAIIDHTKYLELAASSISLEEKAAVLLYRAMGQPSDDAAIRDLDESISVVPTATAYYFRACVYAHEERYADVIEQCTKALELEPDFVEAIELRIDTYMCSGNPAAAERDIAALTRARTSDAVSPFQTFAAPTHESNQGAPGEPSASRYDRGKTKVLLFFNEKSLFSGNRWRFAFGSYGLISLFSPVVLFMTIAFGLAGFGSGVALCAVLLLLLSLYLHWLARIFGGQATLRDTAVVVAWSGMLTWVLLWIPVLSSYAPISAATCAICGIVSQHKISVLRSITVVVVPPLCLFGAFVGYVFSQDDVATQPPILHAQSTEK